MKYPPIPDDVRERIFAAYRAGKTVKECSDASGVKYHTIMQMLERHGLRARKRQQKRMSETELLLDALLKHQQYLTELQLQIASLSIRVSALLKKEAE